MHRSLRFPALAPSVVLLAWLAAASPLAAQEPVEQRVSDLDLILNYGYLGAFFDPGIAGYEVEGRTVRVLNVPLKFKVRDWEGRGWGLQLRLAGVLGVENVDGIGDLPDARVGALAVIPGLEVPIPLGERSLLRPYVDLGLAFALDDPEELSPGTVGISALGMRSEFLFPWRRFELGLEPSAMYSVTWSSDELRDDYGIIGLRADAHHPLFHISDHLLTGVLYAQPGWFIDALSLAESERETGSIRAQMEIGVGYAWRGDPPKIWFFEIPPMSIGYSFGDGLEGVRLRVGSSRLTHLPPETWDE